MGTIGPKSSDGKALEGAAESLGALGHPARIRMVPMLLDQDGRFRVCSCRTKIDEIDLREGQATPPGRAAERPIPLLISALPMNARGGPTVVCRASVGSPPFIGHARLNRGCLERLVVTRFIGSSCRGRRDSPVPGPHECGHYEPFQTRSYCPLHCQ